MKQVIGTLAVLAILGQIAAGAVVGLGLYNVSARVGHLPGVSWLLHTTFRNSVRLRAPAMTEAPDLSDPDLIALGAGHYATACAPCHAAPGGERSATIRSMNPVPPPIDIAVGDWAPNELHWIVENGVKMSGMPSWPARQRGDEVWSVIAFLVALREGTAPLPAPRASGFQAYCAACHGKIGGLVPRLDILAPDYIAAQLSNYSDGTRPSGVMAQALSLVPSEAIGELSEHVAEAEAPEPSRPAPGSTEAGRDIARRGTREIPACAACHEGPAPRKGPALAGQHEAYLGAQLRLWRDGTYTHDALMSTATQELTDADIDALAAYYAVSGAEADNPAR